MVEGIGNLGPRSPRYFGNGYGNEGLGPEFDPGKLIWPVFARPRPRRRPRFRFRTEEDRSKGRYQLDHGKTDGLEGIVDT